MAWQLIGNIGGKDGRDGKDIDLMTVNSLVETAVLSAVKAMPLPQDGKDGRDGLGLTGAVINREGALVLTLSDGSTKNVGLVVGKDGVDGLRGKDFDPVELRQEIAAAVAEIPRPLDGKDGADGFGFDDLDLVFDEMQGWLFRFQSGDHVKDFPLPVPFDAGVWQAGRQYPQAAGVTVKGAWWIAQRPTMGRPGDEGSGWRLSVKGGKDGKPGRDGRNGADA